MFKKGCLRAVLSRGGFPLDGSQAVRLPDLLIGM
jgi:hypothetical protein